MTTISSFRGEYFFLSNFYPFVFTWDGVDYPTLEHVYQASKTEDLSLRHDIARAGTPGKAKRMGRTVPLRPNWDRLKLKVMHELLLIKFMDPTLRNLLLDTGDSLLEEVNNWGDTYWGRCDGVGGGNWLGVLLMLVRSEVCAETDWLAA
jgi:ribA/ribD-fused uncharacterized protein